jgi:hypothetical protein
LPHWRLGLEFRQIQTEFGERRSVTLANGVAGCEGCGTSLGGTTNAAG